MLGRLADRLGRLCTGFKPRYLRSLQVRIILLSAGLFVTFLWILVFASSAFQQRQFSRILFDQQYAGVQRLAGDLNNKLQERVQNLNDAASQLPHALKPAVLDESLSAMVGLHAMFSGGIAVIGLDGKTIADFPSLPGRRDAYLGDRDYFIKAVATRRPYIDKPVIGRALNRPVLAIAVPVLDKSGHLRAVMTGVTDLTAPNFLGIDLARASSGSGQFLIVSPRDHVIIAATDAKRVMTEPPAKGVNLLYDRFADGFEGSGIAVDSGGDANLYSGKYVPAANWLVMAALPAEIAFRPVAVMRNYLIGVASVLTILAVFLIHWMTQRLLAPLGNAERSMREMAEGKAPLAPLPVSSTDELDGLIDNFNVLVKDRCRDQEALAESEQRFRALCENAPDAIVVLTHGCFAYVNAATMRFFGAKSKNQLLGKPLASRIPPEFRALVEARVQQINQTMECVPPFEQKTLRLDGSVAYAEVSAIPFYYGNARSSLVFARDITDRKRAVRALRESEDRFHRLVTLASEWYWELDEQYRFSQIFGWNTVAGSIDAAGFIGKTRWELSPEVDDAIWDTHRAVLDARLPFSEFEYASRADDGRIAWFSISGEPKFADDGRFVGYYGTGKNITRRKRAEEAIRNSESRIRELAAHQEKVKEEERKRIARDLHDDLGQMLLTLRIDISMLLAQKDNTPPQMHRALTAVLAHMDATMKSVKQIVNDLRPSVLDLGLLAAIEWQVQEFQRSSGIVCHLIANNDDFERHLDEDRSAALFRAVQESLTNITRHAKASKVEVMIKADSGRLEISVEDDGVGLAPGSIGKINSFGLVGIEERMCALGGKLAIKSNPGMGTALTLSIPITSA